MLAYRVMASLLMARIAKFKHLLRIFSNVVATARRWIVGVVQVPAF